MKKTLITLALAGAACAGMAQQKCQITGHIDGAKSDTLFVLVVDENYSRQERIDTVMMKNGDLSYDIECVNMRSLMLVPANGGVNNSLRSGYMQVLAMPGEKAVIKGSAEEYFFSGSKFYTDYNEYDRLTTPIYGKIKAIQDEYSRRVQAGEDQGKLSEELSPKFEAAQNEINEAGKSFIKSHPTSHVSGYLLGSVPAGERAQYAALLTAEVKSGPTAAYLKSIEKREAAAKAREEAAKKIQPGCDAPDFTLNDIKGKPLALSSLRGKYVVLDFWGSWCGWCIKGMPKMKEYYDKYKAKGLEILGVDCNDTDAKWKAAVEKHQLPWLHVYCPRESDVTTKYAISGYPTKIVVGKDGKIVKVIVGEDPEFYTYLDELFK